MMTGKERIARQLSHQSVDRIGVGEDFWEQTCQKWEREGHIKVGEDPINHFDLDLSTLWAFNYTLHPEEKNVILEEDEETYLLLNGNHSKLRYLKHHASPPENIGYEIVDRKTWEEIGKPFLTPSRDRINFSAYRNEREQAARRNRFFLLVRNSCI